MIRYLRISLYLAVALAVSVPELVSAQAWTQDRGAGYYQISVRMLRTSTYIEPGGGSISIPTLGDYVASFYGEYGVTDRLTAVVDFPFFERITRNELIGRRTGFVFTAGDAVNGIADGIVGLRIGIFDGGSTVASGSVKLGIPVGDATHPGGLWTGDGEFNQVLTLEAGHSWYPIPAYSAIALGYNNRTEGFSDEIVFGVEAGYTISVVTTIARIRGVEPLRNGRSDVGGQGGFGGNEVRYLSFGIEAAFELFSGGGLRVSADGAARKQNVLSGLVFGAGVYLKR